MRLFRPFFWLLVLIHPFAALSAYAESSPDPVFTQVIDKARSLAQKPYAPPDSAALPPALRNLNYQQYRDIRFDKQHALWHDNALFSVELFHLGFLYRAPVIIHEVDGNSVKPLAYDPAMFNYGKNDGLRGVLHSNLGFAGFRIHFPIKRPHYKDEIIAFLGASYFRMVGRDQRYGLSARGLAINTASPKGEEFPRFREFWLVKPGPDATTMTFYALLDSASVTGAFRFDLSPGSDTVLKVTSRLFARTDVDVLGIAPLTSMFLFGENTARHFDDYRSEVHDSDGLLMHTGADEWIWRPLNNRNRLEVSSLMDIAPKGFGLMQRDRNFDHYLDLESHFETRPSLWVRPTGGDWGKGAVRLVEIPTDSETNDNIVAFWVPERPFRAGEERAFNYELRTIGERLPEEQIAHVARTRIGWGAIPGAKNKPPRSVRQFIVDFHGGELDALDPSQPVKAELHTSFGQIQHLTVQPLPGNKGWRVAFKLTPETGKPADMRLFLTLQGRCISETWSYLWQYDVNG